jgi:choline dehydrogenase
LLPYASLTTISFTKSQLYHLYFSYDFIIIGGGSAGSVLANRLSEIPSWKILLLEAGSDENTVSDIPAVAAYLQGSSLDWQFKTEPQPTACLGLVGKYKTLFNKLV